MATYDVKQIALPGGDIVNLKDGNAIHKSNTSGFVKNDGSIDQNTYQIAQAGKGLSTNDYDDTDKAKVDMIDNTTTSATGNPISIADLKSAQIALNPTVTYNPIQDLHGQSKPYPAGGGKNKFNIGWVYTTSIFSVSGTKITKTTSAYNADLFSGNTGQAQPSVQKLYLTAGTYTLSYTSTENTNIFVDSIDSSTLVPNGGIATSCPSGGGTSFTVSTDSWVCLKVTSNLALTISNLQIESGSSATSYAPYENICPISGYDKIEVLSCGANIWNENWEVGSIDNETGQNDDHDNYNIRQKDYTMVNPNQAYFFKCASKSLRLYWYDANYNFISTDVASTVGTPKTSPTNARYFRIRTTSSYGSTYLNDIMVNVGNSGVDYQPYHKTTDLSESLGQTVYYASYNVRTGDFENKGDIVDLGDFTWSYWSAGQLFYTSLPNYKRQSGCKAVCTQYDYIGIVSGSGGVTDNNTCALLADSSANTRLYVKDTRYTDGALLKAALVGVKFAYEKASPTEIQLTPHEIALSQDYAYLSTNGTLITLAYHNGEMASLADVSQLGETLNALEDKVSANDAGTQVNLMTYDTSSNKYVCPSDGYISLSNAGSSVGDYIIMSVYGANDNLICGLRCDTSVANIVTVQNLFVKRGMKCYVRATSSTGSFTALFTPLA